MSNDKATPRPWYMEDRVERYVILAEGYDYEIASLDDAAIADEEGKQNVEADAALIVEAVNSYDALKARVAELEAEQEAVHSEGDRRVARVREATDNILKEQNAELVEALRDLLENDHSINNHDSGGDVTHRFAGDGEITGCRWCLYKARARAAIAKAGGCGEKTRIGRIPPGPRGRRAASKAGGK